MKVVITGLGAVSAAGVGIAALAEVLKGSPPLQPAESAGPLDLAGHLNAAKTYLDRNSQLALLAGSMALNDAGLAPVEEGLNIGVSFGTAFGNLQTTETFLTMLREKGPKLASPLLFIHSYPNTSSSLMAIEWSLTGPALNFCTGSSAGADAMIAAADVIADGKADAMLTGAAETDGKLLRACYPELGFREAAGMFTLETEESAIRREAVIHAELSSWVKAGDARTCAAGALERAGLKEGEIDLVVIDGIDTVEGFTQEKCLQPHRYTGKTLSAGPVLAVIAAAMRIESNANIRSALVLTSGIDSAAWVLRRHEQS